jgi:hypothetical protein
VLVVRLSLLIFLETKVQTLFLVARHQLEVVLVVVVNKPHQSKTVALVVLEEAAVVEVVPQAQVVLLLRLDKVTTVAMEQVLTQKEEEVVEVQAQWGHQARPLEMVELELPLALLEQA